MSTAHAINVITIVNDHIIEYDATGISVYPRELDFAKRKIHTHAIRTISSGKTLPISTTTFRGYTGCC